MIKRTKATKKHGDTKRKAMTQKQDNSFTAESYRLSAHKRRLFRAKGDDSTYSNLKMYLEKRPVIYNKINAFDLLGSVCTSYERLLTDIGGEKNIESLLSVFTNICNKVVQSTTVTATVASHADDVVDPALRATAAPSITEIAAVSDDNFENEEENRRLAPINEGDDQKTTEEKLREEEEEKEEKVPVDIDAENKQVNGEVIVEPASDNDKEGEEVDLQAGGQGNSSSQLWAGKATPLLKYSRYEFGTAVTEVGLSDEEKFLGEMLRLMATDYKDEETKMRKLLEKPNEMLILLKRTVTRASTKNIVVDTPSDFFVRASLQPEISFVMRYVPKYLQCDQKSILAYLMIHGKELNPLNYLKFLDRGHEGPDFLRNVVTILNDVTGLIQYSRNGFQVIKQENEVFVRFASPVDGFFFSTRFFAISEFCSTMLIFVSSLSRWPRFSSGFEKLAQHVPFFTDLLLLKLVNDLFDGYKEMNEETLFTHVKNVLHIFYYNFFLVIIATRLNVVKLSSDMDSTEFIGDLFKESEHYIIGLEKAIGLRMEDIDQDDKSEKERKLEFYSVLLRYLFYALEHVTYFFEIQVAEENQIRDFKDDFQKWKLRLEQESVLIAEG